MSDPANENNTIQALQGVTAQDVETVENNVIAEIQQEAAHAASEEFTSRLTRFDTDIHNLQVAILKTEEELQKHSQIWKDRRFKEKELNVLRRKLTTLQNKRKTFKEAANAREALKAVPKLSDNNTAGDKRNAHESEKDFLVRTGKITPFQSTTSQGRAPKRRKLSNTATPVRKRPRSKLERLSEDPDSKNTPRPEEGKGKDVDYDPLDDVEADEEEDSIPEDSCENYVAAQKDEEEEEEVMLSEGLRIPGSIYDRLFDYQKTGVQWLWELHNQECGGIIGDEMGLGKTIQVIAFLAALQYSGKLEGPVIIVAPTTVLQQWQREFTKWGPQFTVRVLHQSVGHYESIDTRQASRSPTRLIADVVEGVHGVLITSYEQVRKHQKKLLAAFEYVILDEGHKIRNPNARITLVCKQFDTPHRIIMSGSPLQNNLKELWSLFDFVFPGKLGTLPVFEEQFSVPIAVGGYISASKSEVHTAYKCAVVLRDLVSPYLLRRMKKDVALQLPKKNEQVLFCRLAMEQRLAYEEYVASRAVRDVLNGDMNLLAAISVLRKICNHPDIVREASRGRGTADDESRDLKGLNGDYGSWKKSGKLQILNHILPTWLEAGSRVLLFSQSRMMLDVVELFAKDRSYNYRRMDGETAIGRRMRLIDEFNNDPDIFLFLLTTKVGGLGVNLTGADRVVIIE